MTVLFLMLSVQSFSQTCDISCDDNTPIQIGASDHTITYAGRLYDSEECKTYFYYCVTNGSGNAISHSLFGESSCGSTCLDGSFASLGKWSIDGSCNISYSAVGTTKGNDPPTGYCGIKVDEGFNSEGDVENYYLSVDGNQPEGEITFVVKAGPTDYNVTVTGPEQCEGECCDLTCPEDKVFECGDVRTCIDFEEFEAGDYVDTIFTDLGPVLITGVNPSFPGQNAAMIFDSDNPTGDDFDLGTPNNNHGGPGIGVGGVSGKFVNTVPHGKILIVTEDFDPSDPDDDAQTGDQIVFDFSLIGPVTIERLRLIDINDNASSANIEAFGPGNTLLATFPMQNAGDNGTQIVDLGNTPNIERVEVNLDGSGSVEDLCFTNTTPSGFPTGTCDDDPNPNYEIIDDTIGIGCLGNFEIQRTFIARTESEEIAFECTQVITFDDNNPPELIGVPDDLTVECDEIPSVAEVTAEDDCEGELDVTFDEVIGSGCSYTITRTWSAMDDCGNTVSDMQIITVVDTEGPSFGICENTNPLSGNEGFLVFIEGDATLESNETESSLAVGGNLTINGNYQVATNTTGGFVLPGDDEPVGLLVNGKVLYENGNTLQVLQDSWVKIGDCTGSNVYEKDENNVPSNLRVTPAGYNASPRIQSQTMQPASTVCQSGLIDFNSVFEDYRARSSAMSFCNGNVTLLDGNSNPVNDPDNPPQTVKIGLESNSKNVLDIKGSAFNQIQNFIFNDVPDASTPLILNIDAAGDFVFDVPSFSGISNQDARYVLFNFYNTTDLEFTSNSNTILGSVFAPFAEFRKLNSSNVEGNVIATKFEMTGGEIHPNGFETSINMCECGGCPQPLTVECDDPDFDNVINNWLSSASAFDACSSLTITNDYNQQAECGNYTISFTATDDCGNSTTCQANLEIVDNNAPTIVCPADLTINYEDDLPVSYTTITAFENAGGSIDDNCGGLVFVLESENTTGNKCDLQVTTRVYSVTDACGNSSTCEHTITREAANLNCDVVGQNVSCEGGDDGSATVSPDDGVAPYTYAWSNGENTQTINNISAGPYVVTITDANGCISTCNVIITEPMPLTCSIAVNQNVSCNGGNDGSATVSGSGGTAPYTYAWPDGNANATVDTLSAGNYVVTITDANGCMSTCDVTISEAGDLTCSIAVNQNVSCNGGNDGSATVSGSGGTAPYTYAWPDGNANATVDTLPAGNYVVTITDANGCMSTCDVMILESGDLTCSIAVNQNVSCNGGKDGSATVSGSGGTAPYTYAWPDGNANATVDTLSAGNYVVTITDANGCVSTCDVTILESGDLTCSIAVNQNVSCNGGNDGSATVSGSGGTAPYTYAWPDGNANATVDTLPAGNYVVTITDANGCVSTCDVTIIEPTPLTCSIAVNKNVSCNGGNDGSATVSGNGGTAPYTYAWLDGNANATVDTLSAGNYVVTITDANGCISTCDVTILESGDLTCNIVVNQDVSCNGGSNGSATVSGSGGTAPYTYAWPDGNANATVDTLSAGYYVVTITDANGCVSTCDVTILESGDLTCSIAVNKNVSCNGGNDGSATVSGSGGTAPYTYAWPDGNANATVDTLSAGNYVVTITDANGCISTCDVTILESGDLTCSIAVNQNVSCNGGNDGSATVSGSGGTAPYTYAWPDGNTNATVDTLSAGNYVVTITDANGCMSTCDVTISEAGDLTCSIAVNQNVSCNGGNDGSATVSGSGGTAPYTYAWPDGNANATVDTLSAGNYVVTITDANGCISTCDVTILESGDLTCSIAVNQNVSCNGGNDGSATVSGSGGTTPYTYAWPDGNANAIVDTLSAGNYVVTITDANGCMSTCDVTILEPMPLTCNIVVNQDVSCNGGNNGSATVSGSGGTTPYTYAWPDGNANATVDTLSAGNYVITISDANGCVSTCDVTILESGDLTCSIAVNENVSCNGGNDGSATVSGSGGTAPYTYAWPDGNANATVDTLSAGNYVITISDANGCISTCDVTILESGDLTCSIAVNQNVSCNGGNDGSATVSGSGGTTPYTYAWPDGNANATVDTLSAGNYVVTITDANGCMSTCDVTILEPMPLTCNIVVNQDVSCNGGNNGSATVSGSGGTTPYTYAWPDGNANATVDTLSAGNYVITISDANGCVSTCDVTILESGDLTCSIAVNENVSCNGGNDGSATVSGSGGTAPYTYAWPDGNANATVDTLSAGNYVVTITDANGCISTCDVTILESGDLTCSIAVNQDVSCNGGNDGSATVSGSGGTAPYTYAWPDGNANATVDTLSAGNYVVTITDANGCISTCDVTILESGDLTCSIAVNQNVSCNGGNDGSATVSGSGGTAPYTYAWPDGNANATVDTLSAGNYVVTITDVNGCVSTCDVTIIEPTPLTCNIVVNQEVSCNGGNDGSATVSGSGGTAPYTYAWPDGNTNARVDTLSAGNYVVTITDVNGCMSTCDVTILEPMQLTCSIAVNQDVSCNGGNDGSATVSGSGGTAPYTYEWPDGNANATVDTLSAGNYVVTITDANGCVSTCDVTILESGDLTCSIAVNQNVSCNGGNDGSATVSGSGGTAPYTYAWPDGNANATVDTLSAGNYVVTITDANGCISTCDVTITEPDPPSVSCPNDITLGTCLTYDEIQSEFVDWIDGFSNACSCTIVSETDLSVFSAPNGCGGTIEITYEVEDECGNTASCSASFTVISPPDVAVSCPAPINLEECSDQGAVDAAFANWIGSFSNTGGCGTTATDLSDLVAPFVCIGDTITVEYTATDTCGQSETCTSSFAVAGPSDLVVSCPNPVSFEECSDQAAVDAAFANWIGSFSNTGGCGTTATDLSDLVAPLVCIGDTITVEYTATDTCGQSETCTSSFAVAGPLETVLSCPSTILTECDIDEIPGYVSWSEFIEAGGGINNTCGIDTASFELISEYNDEATCPRTVTRVYEITDICGNTAQCSQTIIINDETDPVVSILGEDIEIIGNENCEAIVPELDYNISDNCTDSVDIQVTQTPSAGTVVTGPDTIDIVVEIVDGCGNIDADTIQLAIVCSASVGDYVWHDFNDNGIQDPNEDPIDSIKVTLYDDMNNIVGMDTTDVNGFYLFDPVPPGNYFIEFALKDGFVFAKKDKGSDNELDSDVDTISGITNLFTLNPNQDRRDIDAGMLMPRLELTSISECVQDAPYLYYMITRFGVRNTDDVSLNWISLGTGDTLYTFSNLPDTGQVLWPEAGVDIDGNGIAWPGWQQDSDGNWFQIPTDLRPEVVVEFNVNPTVRDTISYPPAEPTCSSNPKAVVGDYVWIDSNNDGIQDPNETPVENVEVYLLDVNGNYIDTTYTDVDGLYYFYPRIGSYSIEFQVPSGYLTTKQNEGMNDSLDSDPDMNGIVPPFMVNPGDRNLTFDMGLICPVEITECPDDYTAECGDDIDPDIDEIQYEGCCDLDEITSTDSIVAGCGGTSIIYRTYTVTDVCGFSASCMQVITIEDNTPPIANCGNLDLTVECSGSVSNDDLINWHQSNIAELENCVTDECNAELVITSDFNVNNFNELCGNTGSITVVYVISDECGNSTTVTGVYIIEDNTDPVLECPSVVTSYCDIENFPPYLTLDDFLSDGGEASDNCLLDETSFRLVSETSDGTSCPEVITRVYELSDACGNTVRCTQEIIIDDEEAPVIEWRHPMLENLPNGGVIEIQCESQNEEWELPVITEGDATITDNCGEVDVQFTHDYTKGDCQEDGFFRQVECKWIATDQCGNVTERYFILRIVDNVAPIITGVPEDITLSCGTIVDSMEVKFCKNEPEEGVITIYDECECADVTYEEFRIDGACSNSYEILRRWTGTDNCGNTTVEEQRVTFIDDSAPIIELMRPEIAGIPNGGRYTMECNFFQLPEWFLDLGESDALMIDNCSTSETMTMSFANEYIGHSTDCSEDDYLERYKLTWTATDECGNTSGYFIYFDIVDRTAPAIIGVDSVVCGLNRDPWAGVEVKEDCSSAELTYEDIERVDECTGNNMIYRIYTATDVCGNSSQITQRMYPEDTEKPEISLREDIPVSFGDTISRICGSELPEWGLKDATISNEECADGVEFTFEIIESDDPNCSETGFGRILNYTWTAIDRCGNVGEGVVSIGITDIERPRITGISKTKTIDCGEEWPYPTIVEGCSQYELIETRDTISSDPDCLSKEIVRLFEVVDACGNSSQFEQLLRIVDIEGPVFIGVPQNGCGPVEAASVIAVDECSQDTFDVVYSESDAVECSDGSSYIERTWTSTDACGNESTVTRYNLIDVQEGDLEMIPMNTMFENLVPGESVMVYCDLEGNYERFGAEDFVAVNACGIEFPVEYTEVYKSNSDCKNEGFHSTMNASWRAEGICGQVGLFLSEISFSDSIVPLIYNEPKDITLSCGESPVMEDIIYSDNCGDPTMNYNESTIPMGGDDYIIRREWLIEDACGNSAFADQEITMRSGDDFDCEIIVPEVVQCNDRNVNVRVETKGGYGPMKYEWEVLEGLCIIADGQGTNNVDIHIGFGDVVIRVTVTDFNGCVTVCEYTIECEFIKDVSVEALTLFPNPASNELFINLENASVDSDEEVVVKLLDITGQIAKDLTYRLPYDSQRILSVKTADLASGTYIVLIDQGSKHLLRDKIIIVHE